MEKIKKTFYKVVEESTRPLFPKKEYVYIQAYSVEQALLMGISYFGGSKKGYRHHVETLPDNQDTAKE